MESSKVDIIALSDAMIQQKIDVDDSFIPSDRFTAFLIDYLNESYGICASKKIPDVRCFVNAQSNTFDKVRNNICGDIQLSPVRSGIKKGVKKTIVIIPDIGDIDLQRVNVLYDSGAFTDVLTNSRVTPEESLERQLATIDKLLVSKKYKDVARDIKKRFSLVSYDLLIDEKYVNGTRKKERWSIDEGEKAVKETVKAAKYMDSQRQYLKDFQLIQSVQGVDARQYQNCLERVLEFTSKSDTVGLGGWCILGKQRHWLPTFFETITQAIPAIAESGVKKVHIFGVTWYKTNKCMTPPLPVLLRLCDEHNLELSTDSRSPISNALWKGDKWRKAGATFPFWRDNLAWVKAELATLRDSPAYQFPPKKWSIYDEPLFQMMMGLTS